MFDGLFFCAMLTRRGRGHTLFVHAGAETSDTGAEVVKPDPPCSRRVGADVGDESTESRSVVTLFQYCEAVPILMINTCPEI